MSRFNLPREEKTRPWEDHLMFLDRLQPWLKNLPTSQPLIIVGDFNQRVPRVWTPHHVYTRMMDVFSGLHFVTEGALAPLDEQTIDHVVIAGSIKTLRIEARSRFEHDGRPRSDHFGVVVDFESTGSPP